MKKVITAAAIIIATAMMLNAQTETIVLQQGFDGYTGCKAKELRDPDKDFLIGSASDRVLVLREW